MAWEDVNYSCGHSERHQFYGPHAERDRKREWMERGVCTVCFHAKKEGERRQESERAAKLATEIGFSPLTGSGKQIAWATSIRQKMLESLLAKNGIKGKIVNYFNHETSAKWWIDHRETAPYTILETIVKLYDKEGVSNAV